MDHFLWTALVLGVAGSAHCLGMCGPIAVALPGRQMGRSHYLQGRMLYNLGRTITYALMGGVLGMLGLGAWLAGYQQMLSIFSGAAIIVITLMARNHFWTLDTGFLSGMSRFFQAAMSPLMKTGNRSGLLMIGVLNGFLPCGLVYVALAAALTTGSIVQGMLYMTFFGAGTSPVMFLAALSPGLLSGQWQKYLQQIIPWLAVLVGVLLILRGLSLGIPMVSPNLGAGGSPCSQMP